MAKTATPNLAHPPAPAQPAPACAEQLPPAADISETVREPKPRKLVKVTNADGTEADTLPLPPRADPGLPVPRLVHQNERAPAGLARFKVAARNYHPQPLRYVLAADEAEARKFYLERCTTLAHELAQARKAGENPEAPRLAVTRLDD